MQNKIGQAVKFKTRFDEILNQQELEELYNSTNAQGRPPSWGTIFCADKRYRQDASKADFTTYRAFTSIIEETNGKNWLLKQKYRLLPPTEYSEIASMMAEIRCYGGLLQAGYVVEPIDKGEKPTPDFKVKYNNFIRSGEIARTFYVEVAAKREDGAETNITESIAKGNLPVEVQRKDIVAGARKIQFTTREVFPLGKPDPKKPNDSATANAISRICAIKQKETQALENEPTLLWIDFIDLDSFRGRTFTDHFGILITNPHNGGLTSGFIWYAFYGWKGAPIFEFHSFTDKRVIMGHHGRFNNPGQPSKYNGALISIEGSTVFFENPQASFPLNQDERMMLHGLPNFSVNKSVASWYKSGANELLTYQRKTIQQISSMEVRPAAGHHGPLFEEE